MTNDRTVEPAYYEFATNAEGDDITTATHIALIVVERDGTRTAVAVAAPDAERVGRLILAHSDAIAKRPPRKWD